MSLQTRDERYSLVFAFSNQDWSARQWVCLLLRLDWESFLHVNFHKNAWRCFCDFVNDIQMFSRLQC